MGQTDGCHSRVVNDGPPHERPHQVIRYRMLGRFTAMRIYENVRVHSDQESPPAIDLVTHVLPRHRKERVGSSRFPHASVRQRISHMLFFQHCPKTFLNDRPQWSPGSSGVPLGSIQQRIADFDRRLHIPILPIRHGQAIPEPGLTRIASEGSRNDEACMNRSRFLTISTSRKRNSSSWPIFHL